MNGEKHLAVVEEKRPRDERNKQTFRGFVVCICDYVFLIVRKVSNFSPTTLLAADETLHYVEGFKDKYLTFSSAEVPIRFPVSANKVIVSRQRSIGITDIAPDSIELSHDCVRREKKKISTTIISSFFLWASRKKKQLKLNFISALPDERKRKQIVERKKISPKYTFFRYTRQCRCHEIFRYSRVQ